MSRRVRHPMLAALTACGLLGTSCIPSNVVAAEDRMVVEDLGTLDWQPAPALQLDGLYQTVDIQGQAAVALRKVYYLFSNDGSYTAAALTESDGEYSFQTLDGTWSNGPDGLVLDDGDPVRCEQAGDHVRISATSGLIVLERARNW